MITIFNWFKKTRNQDDIFEQDDIKNNTKRGNQKIFSTKSYLIKNLIALLLIFASVFILTALVWSGIVKFIRFVYLVLIMNTPLEEGNTITNDSYITTFFHVIWGSGIHLLVVLLITFTFAFMIYRKIYRRLKGKRVRSDHTDLNTYVGDKKKLNIEEMFKQYNIFPDAGAVSKSVKPTAIVGHAFLSKDGKINDVKMAVRDEDGNVVKTNKGKIKYETLPMFDKELQKESYVSIGIQDKQKQIVYDPTKINYRKIGKKWQTVADFINGDWFLPEDEMQRPAGIYFVETGPVNTVAIGTTRSAKGQTLVNNTIDMFSREYEKQNMFLNDPKGDLFAAFHKLLESRGFEPIVLNLMDPSKTHQFNVLAPAIAQARIGKYDKMGTLLTTIMNTFFPKQKDDPFWGEATQALVKMIIFALIDYYLEEERAYLEKYSGVKDEATIGRELDAMWGKVTMFNAYQMITTMSRREVKLKDPEAPDDAEAEQVTQLTAFFKMTDKLPLNKMRIITLQQSDAMSQMAPSEKTRATIYGIALTAMLFFTNGPITAITSASPRQSLDPVSLAFPRRLRFKMNSEFLKENKLNDRKVRFSAYRDTFFKDQIKTDNPIDFEHTTRFDEIGWAEFRFKGIFEEYNYIDEDDGTVTAIPKPIYIKMEVIDDRSGLVMHKYYFEFTRGYAKTVDNKHFIRNPHDGRRVEKDGTIRVGSFDKNKGYVKGNSQLKTLANGMTVPEIEQTEAVYNIRPKAVFSITPPHLSEYIKVVIVMVSVLFDTSVAESYITDESGKPHYKTRSILDEIGNMQFDGHGIPDFQTKLSIGLGQGQEYTMIVQTLQQFRDVYGDSADKIIQSNTAVFMYLISNDTDMLDMLSKQAGTTHKARPTQKSYSENKTDFINSMEENVQTNIAIEEEPLFPINELLSFTKGESMVISARHDTDNSGEKVRPNPIHNTKGSMIPMAYALHKNGHNHPKFKKALQNVEIATSSTDRDVYQDVPDFEEMYKKREQQALLTPTAKENYQDVNKLSDTDILKRDVDDVSRDIMRIINGKLTLDKGETINENNLSETDKTIRDKMDEVDIATSSQVPETQKKYDSDINQGQQTGMDIDAIESEKIFVDGTFSIKDLREREYVKETLGKALYSNRSRITKIENELYQYISEAGIKKIIEVQSGDVIASLNTDEVSEGKDFWEVTDAFFEQIENNFNLRVDEVDQNLKMHLDRYFDIDGRKLVFQTLKQMNKEGVA